MIYIIIIKHVKFYSSSIKSRLAPWCSGYHYCSVSFNKAWTWFCAGSNLTWDMLVRDSRWWGSLTMVLTGNKANTFCRSTIPQNQFIISSTGSLQWAWDYKFHALEVYLHPTFTAPFQMEMHLESPDRRLQWSFFAKIVNVFRLLVIFAKELHHGLCMCHWVRMYIELSPFFYLILQNFIILYSWKWLF